MENRILFVGGTWNLEGGKKSKLVDKFSSYLDNVTLYNGGDYRELERIIETAKDYDTVIWWADVDNSLPKVRDVKKVNYKTMLITSKRNVDHKYTFQDLLKRALHIKANLCVEFTKDNGVYGMRLFDPLGNVWYEGNNIEECSKALNNRVNYLKSVTRSNTTKTSEEINPLPEDTKEQLNSEFITLVREYANKFSEAIYETKDVKRFLGNASFRCPKGFPSFRDGKHIYVSRRNVDKEYITLDQFVPVYLKDSKIYYLGDNKPSVDTPIQVRMYQILPNINYMIHSHCYIDKAPFTEMPIPCGAIEEVEEIKKVIDYYYYGDYNRDFYVINLVGHGSIMMAKVPGMLNNIDIVGRPIPEKHDVKKLVLKRKVPLS